MLILDQYLCKKLRTYHDDMISKLRLALYEFWTGGCAGLKSKSNLLKPGVQATLGLPPQ